MSFRAKREMSEDGFADDPSPSPSASPLPLPLPPGFTAEASSSSTSSAAIGVQDTVDEKGSIKALLSQAELQGEPRPIKRAPMSSFVDPADLVPVTEIKAKSQLMIDAATVPILPPPIGVRFASLTAFRIVCHAAAMTGSYNINVRNRGSPFPGKRSWLILTCSSRGCLWSVKADEMEPGGEEVEVVRSNIEHSCSKGDQEGDMITQTSRRKSAPATTFESPPPKRKKVVHGDSEESRQLQNLMPIGKLFKSEAACVQAIVQAIGTFQESLKLCKGPISVPAGCEEAQIGNRWRRYPTSSTGCLALGKKRTERCPFEILLTTEGAGYSISKTNFTHSGACPLLSLPAGPSISTSTSITTSNKDRRKSAPAAEGSVSKQAKNIASTSATPPATSMSGIDQKPNRPLKTSSAYERALLPPGRRHRHWVPGSTKYDPWDIQLSALLSKLSPNTRLNQYVDSFIRAGFKDVDVFLLVVNSTGFESKKLADALKAEGVPPLECVFFEQGVQRVRNQV